MALGESIRQGKGTLERESQVQISLRACSEKFAEQLVHYVECGSGCCPDSQEVSENAAPPSPTPTAGKMLFSVCGALRL